LIKRLAAALFLVFMSSFIAASGCAASAPDARWRCPGPPPAEPAVARRDACLEPPLLPALGEARRASSLNVLRCSKNARELRLEQEGARSPSNEEVFALSDAFNKAKVTIQGAWVRAGVGECCSGCAAEEGGPRGACVRLHAPLCTPLDEIARALSAEVAKAGLGDARMSFCLGLEGRAGPRCEASDPSCGPLPYYGTLEGGGYDCREERVFIGSSLSHLPSRDTTARCSHDGDCIAGANKCVHWSSQGGGTLEMHVGGPPMFCGCVEGTCGWFHMASAAPWKPTGDEGPCVVEHSASGARKVSKGCRSNRR
jgi:hypothetical protein